MRRPSTDGTAQAFRWRRTHRLSLGISRSCTSGQPAEGRLRLPSHSVVPPALSISTAANPRALQLGRCQAEVAPGEELSSRDAKRPTVSSGHRRQPIGPSTVSAGCGVARRVRPRVAASALRKPPICAHGEPSRISVGERRRDPGGPRRIRRAQAPGGSESESDGGRVVRHSAGASSCAVVPPASSPPRPSKARGPMSSAGPGSPSIGPDHFGDRTPVARI